MELESAIAINSIVGGSSSAREHAPSFGNGGLDGCTGPEWVGLNLVGTAELRYDTSQLAGGTFYDSYAHAQELVGSTAIVRASLVLDAGWGGDQRLALNSATVNGDTFTAGDAAAPVATCDLPPATILVEKIGGTPTGSVNEPVTIQPQDGDHKVTYDTAFWLQLINDTTCTASSTTSVWRIGVKLDDNTIPAEAERNDRGPGDSRGPSFAPARLLWWLLGTRPPNATPTPPLPVAGRCGRRRRRRRRKLAGHGELLRRTHCGSGRSCAARVAQAGNAGWPAPGLTPRRIVVRRAPASDNDGVHPIERFLAEWPIAAARTALGESPER